MAVGALAPAASGSPPAVAKDQIAVYRQGRWQTVARNSEDFPICVKMHITPDWAMQVLEERNHENRDEKPNYQDRLIQALRSDRFYTTNQGIGFYESGQLADGQNRLKSIVRSGVAARMFVVFGISPEAKAAIDDGIKRTDTDIRRIYGDRATPRRVIMIANTLISMMRNRVNYPDKFEKQDFYNAYMDGLMFSHNLFIAVKRKGISQMSVLAAITRAYYHCDHQRLTTFVRVLNEGIPDDPQKDVAAIKLRNLLLDDQSGGKQGRSKRPTGYGREEVYRKSEKAIAHFVKEEPIDKLYEARDELFPLPGENNFFGRLTPQDEEMGKTAATVEVARR